MIVYILLGIVIGLWYLHHRVRGGKIGKYVDELPGPPAMPFVGNILLFFGITPGGLWALMRKMNAKFYPIYRVWGYSMAVINLQHPDDAEVLLTSTKHIEKSRVYNFLEPWFSTGLLTSTGTKWQTRRKILTPAFHFNILKQFVDIFVEQGERLIDSMKVDQGIIVKDLIPLFSEHTLNAICETAMGTSLHGRDSEFQKRYRQAVHAMGEILVHRLVTPWAHNDYIFNLSSEGKKQAEALKILHGFTKTIIAERKEYHDITNGEYLKSLNNETDNAMQNEEDVYIFGIKKKRLAMLDLLIAAHRSNNEIDDYGIREEVDTFMFEGHDTTAMSMCFTVLLLAQHKDIQNQAREEVEEALKENGNKMNITVLQKFVYLERCIKESLRLYPSVPFISRAITTDLRLKNHLIPGGTIAHLHIYDLHRDPNFWPNPDKFDPNRFLPQNMHGRHPFSYIPFSAGPRNCIGQRFAMLESKAVIGSLLKNFHFESVDLPNETNFIADLVLRSAHPLRVKFIPITTK